MNRDRGDFALFYAAETQYTNEHGMAFGDFNG